MSKVIEKIGELNNCKKIINEIQEIIDINYTSIKDVNDEDLIMFQNINYMLYNVSICLNNQIDCEETMHGFEKEVIGEALV